MIYCLGLNSELKSIQQHLDKRFIFNFKDVDDDASSIHSLEEAELFLIGSSVENPVKRVQEIVVKDKLLTIIIFALPNQFNRIKQSLQFSMSVGKSTTCISFNPATNYSMVFQNGIVRTQQKRSFHKFNLTNETKLSQLTSTSAKLDNLGHILEHAPIGAILIDMDFNIIGANRSSRKMFSQLNDNQISLDNIFPSTYSLLLKEKVNFNEGVLTVRDLEGHYFEVSKSSVPGSSVNNTILLISDVTERIEKHRRVEAILGSLPHIAWTAEPDGTINYYNQGWYNYTHKDVSEGKGEKWVSIIHPDDFNLAISRWTDSIKEEKIFQQASRFKRYDGEYRWHLSKAVPIFSKNKKIEMWVGTSTDIHDQVIYTEELERKVRDRTKLLEETNAELEQFAHISSHDLQEPLRKINTFAHIVKDEESDRLNENGKLYIDKIITTSTRMTKLLKDLLSFTKINQQEPEGIVNLNDIVKQIKEDLELVLIQTAGSISSEDLPIIKGRPLQIKQLYYNIISNSLKYRRPDVAPSVIIECKKFIQESPLNLTMNTDTEYWEIIVKDNGIGFDQKYADQIFTVFQRLHTRSSYEGTGIGLAIAKKVVRSHGGMIFAISSVGNGAEFHIVLPLNLENE